MYSLKPLLLHALSTGPNPYKVAILLESLSLPYTVKLWDFGDDPQKGVKGSTFLSINENGRVPALKDPNTGVVSWESGACINYLLRVYDRSHKLHPGPDATEQDRVDFDKWVFFLVSSLGPLMGQLNWYRNYHPTKNEDAIQRFEEQALRTYGVLDKQLEKVGGGSVLRGGFSAVDVHFWPWVNQFGFAGLKLDGFPSLQKWYETIKERSDVKKAYEKVPAGEHA